MKKRTEVEFLAKEILKNQHKSGLIKSYVKNTKENWKKEVAIITPTYLSCFLLMLFRTRTGIKDEKINHIIKKGIEYLVSRLYYDSISGLRVSHFNSFYAPDWEDTCMVTLLAYREKLLSKSDLTPLKNLIEKNRCSKGVGVWVRDDYSITNGENNVFDPFVSLTINIWLEEIWNESWNEVSALAYSEKNSLYYENEFHHKFKTALIGNKGNEIKNISQNLFHHGSRTQVLYESQAPWNALQLLNFEQ